MQIINWDKVNTYSFWGGLFFTICHPIVSIKYDRHCYGSFPWKVAEFFTKDIYRYMPFSKACRWLGHKLVWRVYNCKELDDFQSRNREANTKYYFAKAKFGHLKFEEVSYIRNGKGVNTFIDVFVTTFIDKEKGKKNADKIKTVKKTIWSGWVFTKKRAFKLFKEIVKNNPRIYNPIGDSYPEVENEYYIIHVREMIDLLNSGKLPEYAVHDLDTHTLKIYNNSKDKIEKLWCYVTRLLCYQNDFDAHCKLANIHDTCESYLYWYKEFKANPEIDFTYKRFIKVNKIKEAEKYKRDMIKMYNKKATLAILNKQLMELEKFYRTQPYTYFRI